jgi:hypothetical protein
MLNPFFQQGSKSEQNLVQDLINEQLKIYGIDVYYIPRRYVTSKSIIKEVIESKFENAYPIEAYVDTYEGYNGLGTLMSKFGIQEMDDLTITISKERFETYITPLIKDIADIKLSVRPKEGDLIYFPLGDRLFEIKYVEHEKPFYQLQKNYVYQLSCELFRYEDEVLDTGIDNIDDNVVDSGYIQSLTMVGSASTSLAYAQIFNGGVRRVIVTNRGSGYTSTPRVAISSAPSGGLTASGIATMISGIVDCEGISKESRVQGVEIINSGYGYTVAPGVSFIGGGGNGAEAYTQIGDGIVGTITLTSGGSGYYSPPLVSFTNEVFLSGVSTASASATAVVSAAGTISSIRITNAGLGYSVAPTIVIESPYNTGIGTFTFNEIVTGSISSTTAVVNSWNSETNVLKVSKISGSFVIGENIVGSESGASRKLRTLNEYNNTDPYSQNEVIEEEADQIIDFSEGNPFGIS